jgi:hypothetical protein
MLTPLGENKT